MRSNIILEDFVRGAIPSAGEGKRWDRSWHSYPGRLTWKRGSCKACIIKLKLERAQLLLRRHLRSLRRGARRRLRPGKGNKGSTSPIAENNAPLRKKKNHPNEK